MNKYLIFIAFAFFPITTVYGQKCGSDYYMQEGLKDQLLEGETYLDYLIRNNIISEKEIISNQRPGQKNNVVTIPVVVHVIHEYGVGNISKEQIENQIAILNADFQRLNADTNKTRDIFKSRAASLDIEFKLARVAPDGSCTEGINRVYSPLTNNARDNVKSLIRWDYRRYLNIWIVNSIENFKSGEGIVLGFAFFPWMPNPAQLDGIVCRHDRFGNIGTAQGSTGRTMTHEVGHWLGLLHTFNFGCQQRGDGISDTPPVNEPNYGCPIGVNSCNTDNPNLPDMVENYMDYSNGSCMNAFTFGQRDVAYSHLNNSTTRGRNIASTNLVSTGVFTNPTCKPKADFYTDDPNSQTVCAGTPITMKDWSYNGTITSYFWEFTNATPSTSTAKNPTIIFNTTGDATVKLTVTGPGGSDVLTRQNFIKVTPNAGAILPPFQERFASSNSINNWEIRNTENFGWRHNASFGNLGNGCLFALINSNTPNSQFFDITSDGIDLSNVSEALLSFDLAYAKPNTSAVSELLILEISTDCKRTFRNLTVYNEQTGLITQSPANNWVPTNSSHWQTRSVNLSSYIGEKNVHLRFRAVSRSGNSIFIDNFRIENTLSVEKLNFNSNLFKIYPNPNMGKNLTVETEIPVTIMDYIITDISGKVILKGIITKPKEIISIAALNQGMYIFSLISNQNYPIYTQKLVVYDN